MATLHLQILSPDGQMYEGEASEIILQTPQGEIAILPHHVSLFTKISEGEIIVKQSGAKDLPIAVTGGFMEIIEGKVRILADYAIKTDDINIAKAEAAKKEAEKVLLEKETNKDFLLAEKQLQRSILELKIGEKVRSRR